MPPKWKKKILNLSKSQLGHLELLLLQLHRKNFITIYQKVYITILILSFKDWKNVKFKIYLSYLTGAMNILMIFNA